MESASVEFSMNVLLYTAAIILLVVLIILVIRLIRIAGKLDKTVDNVNTKLTSLNGVFGFIDKTTDGLNRASDRFVNIVSDGISAFARRRKEKKRRGE